jgi:hypothetical protein
MSAFSPRLPESLHKKLKEVASQEGISINQFIATAVAKKMAAIMAQDYLQTRAQRGDRTRYEAALARVPDVEPDENDRL